MELIEIAGIVGERVFRHPGLYRCAAPTVTDDALWHTGLFLALAAEEITDG